MTSDGSVVTWGNADAGGNSRDVQEQLAGGIQYIYSTEDAFAAVTSDGSVVTRGATSAVTALTSRISFDGILA